MPSLHLRRAFTLIELLTVIAILGILAAILVPTVGGARDSARRAKTKAQFNQWAAAMELFRQEYGYYPDIATNGKLDTAKFATELGGRTLAGAPPGAESANRKAIAFYSLATDELSDAGDAVVDGFGNADIAVRVDGNRDGLINAADTGSWVSVSGAAGGAWAPTELAGALPTAGVRASVVFYSAGPGHSADDLVLSWR